MSAAQKNVLLPTKLVWWTGLLLSIGIGLTFYMATANSIEHDARERFKHQARSAQYSIATQIKAYTDVLRATASYFQTVGTVSRAQFHRYVAGLDLPAHFPAIDGINFAAYFTDENRDAFEAAVRRSGDPAVDGYPELVIKPAGRRAQYSVLTLIEPIETLAEKVGADIAATPHVAKALAASRDSGTLGASGQPIGFLSRPTRSGLGMRLPVYNNTMPTTTIAERRAAYIGSVGIGFSVHHLVQDALDDIPVRNVRLTLYDGGVLNQQNEKPAPEMLLFDSNGANGAAEAAPNPADLFSIVLPIDFNGRLWRATFSAPKRELYSQFDAYLPWLALAAGVVSSMLLFLLFHTLSSSRMRAINMAAAMTQELRDSQAKLQISHYKLRRLAAHADQIKEEERKRIAREIHDDLGQNLLVLRIEADMLANLTRLRHPRLHARARMTLGQIDATIKSVRNIINDLRPNVLDLGLAAAVEWQIAQFRLRSGIACELIEHPGEISVDDHCATAFFRILQESLSNISQHAKASMVRVELLQQDGMLSMTVSDNGVGILDNNRNKTGSFGLVGIEERISILGGQCAISSNLGAGTTVTVSVPVQADASAAARALAHSADADALHEGSSKY